MNLKTRVGLIYGGESFEHDVSIMTAKSILANIDRSLFEIEEIFVSKNGNFDKNKLKAIDVAFIAMHGPNCEDGKFQEYLDKIGIKYTGTGAKASKINMNKSLMHSSFAKAGLPIVKYLSFSKEDQDKIYEQVLENLELPFFVKPNNAGSSVGISKVDDKTKLMAAVKESFKYDNNIVIEEGVKPPREIEIAILGNKDLIVSEPGEILTDGQFYSYKTKYLSPFKTTTNAKNISAEQTKNLKELAILAFKGTGCKGYARVDFLLDGNNKIYISEINTLPGFTKISMFPKLMQNTGIGYKEMITRIIQLALE
jgi:D-alanine-D-alanine ligase